MLYSMEGTYGVEDAASGVDAETVSVGYMSLALEAPGVVAETALVGYMSLELEADEDTSLEAEVSLGEGM